MAHLEWFVQDGEFLWTVNSRRHFLMVITNVAKALGDAPDRISEHFSMSGLG